ncbi:hypothetical protein SY89_03401 [Halolamina pelagica]|uniref:DUF7344 domain-containing protein n=1 Tax=Halolamina pelagica TaxID=699431 RepID=A0A0P7GL04_9EURY|nr:hypothetical protein [Halolamina pelagica]KPN29167.1 hypothetical protein SY89_03401 [Halolamina pelagica]
MVADNKGEAVAGTTTAETAPGIDDVADAESVGSGEQQGVEEVDAEPLSLDVIFEILRNRRRQLVLEFLRDREDPVTIGELAEHIAAIENETTVRQLNAQQRKRVYIGLYQCHLPKMDDVEVIDFNQSRGRITAGSKIDPLYDYLDVANGEHGDDDEAPFERKHGVGFVATTAAFFAAQLAGAYLLASVFVLLLLVGTAAVVAGDL